MKTNHTVYNCGQQGLTNFLPQEYELEEVDDIANWSRDRWMKPGYELTQDEMGMLIDFINQLSFKLGLGVIVIPDWVTSTLPNKLGEMLRDDTFRQVPKKVQELCMLLVHVIHV